MDAEWLALHRVGYHWVPLGEEFMLEDDAYIVRQLKLNTSNDTVDPARRV